MKIFYAFIIVSLFDFGIADGQNYHKYRRLQVPPTVCYASDQTEKSFIPPPPEILFKSGSEKKSDIIVTYSLFPPEAKAAFEYAVGIWESVIESEIPIYIEARWRTLDNNTLGSAGPNDYYADFEFAPRKNFFYPVAVAEKITGTEISGPSSPDITATFNKDVKWYFGTDGNTPDLLYDFVTVVLHEIGHGLGFTGFFFVTKQSGAYGNENAGDIAAFDVMVVNQQNEALIDTTIFEMPSQKLYNALISNNLYSASPAAITGNAGKRPSLYAPSTWNAGSSIYHLDDNVYPFANPNSLMTHAIGKGEAIHDPGPITMGILADIGWKHAKLKLEKPKDIEEKKPIVFNLSIESDIKIESNAVFLYFSFDSFKNNKDSTLLVFNVETGLFSTTLNPAIEKGTIDYYISVRDKLNRTFLLPTEYPRENYSITIGPDNEPPVISHSPIKYFVTNGDKISITSNIDDNLGIDSVYTELWINNVQQKSFELKPDSATIYSGIFDFDPRQFNDGDEITYRITAIDSSTAKNKTISPANDFFSFKIEKIFEPVFGYYNDFNALSRDFIISDFDIYTEDGFENGSLHSPHPYLSPNKNNSNFNFTTLLKYPVILSENSMMSFDEIVLVEPGEALSEFGDDNFWDYVIVEGSKDSGKTWLPAADGYDSGANKTWENNYNLNIDNNQSSTTVGNPEWYINREIDLLKNGNFKANDTILIRFRLFSDPYAHGWGWTIDNLRIQTPVSTQKILLSPGNILIFPNPFDDLLNVSIEAKSNIEKLSIEIVNLFGQTITAVEKYNVMGEYRIETDLKNVNSGMYLVIVKENGKPIYSKKIIKK